jgi:hypothetical protein
VCAVDDEHHALFECEAFDVLRNDPVVSEVVSAAHGNVRTLMDSGSVSVVMNFISSMMDVIDGEHEGDPQGGSQADQSSPG